MSDDQLTKYLVFGDEIESTDGDRHYISPSQVARLYGVSREECIFLPYANGWQPYHFEGLIWLGPDPSGKYVLPQGE